MDFAKVLMDEGWDHVTVTMMQFSPCENCGNDGQKKIYSGTKDCTKARKAITVCPRCNSIMTVAEMKDRLFNATNCERCGADLRSTSRMTSWFTEETICLTCSSKEDQTKQRLHKEGLDDMEGCGFIPFE